MNIETLRVGHVIEVNGSNIVGELEATVDDLYRTHKSRKYIIGQVGSIVKIEAGDILVFGVVTSLRMVEEEGTSNQNTITSAKWLGIDLLGQGHKTGLNEAEFIFERGVSTYPLPGQAIYLATSDELSRIYKKSDKPTIKVGRVSQALSLPVHLLINEMLGKHFAVLGTTGAGKSCTVALLLQGILNEYPHGHIMLLDPHNEYRQAFPEKAHVIDPTKLELPHWLLNFEETTALFIGTTEHAATSQTNILKNALLHARKVFDTDSKIQDEITVDTPVPYKLGDLAQHINDVIVNEKLNTPTKSASHNKILAKIATLQEDKRFNFMIRKDELVEDNLASLLSNFLRIPVFGKPLTIVDLSGIPSDVLDVVVSVLCRMVFDFSLWNPNREKMPLLLVCEEAHRYIPKSDDVAFKNSRSALARIAKEGRKYGVGLALISQRPSELSESVLSQCNTIVALRMSNEQDQNFIKRALPDSVKSLVDALPALRAKEALVVGEGTTIPVRLLFDDLPPERLPRSADVPFAESWKVDSGTIEDLDEAIDYWRTQKRSSEHTESK